MNNERRDFIRLNHHGDTVLGTIKDYFEEEGRFGPQKLLELERDNGHGQIITAYLSCPKSLRNIFDVDPKIGRKVRITYTSDTASGKYSQKQFKVEFAPDVGPNAKLFVHEKLNLELKNPSNPFGDPQ